mmetsp:Transcript_8718/g.32860  ORF Transcript_8718/g.32860 Transcript_8718/m.32860 type:complete len:293 (+) Transcript_8718:751-1629(+)
MRLRVRALLSTGHECALARSHRRWQPHSRDWVVLCHNPVQQSSRRVLPPARARAWGPGLPLLERGVPGSAHRHQNLLRAEHVGQHPDSADSLQEGHSLRPVSGAVLVRFQAEHHRDDRPRCPRTRRRGLLDTKLLRTRAEHVRPDRDNRQRLRAWRGLTRVGGREHPGTSTHRFLCQLAPWSGTLQPVLPWLRTRDARAVRAAAAASSSLGREEAQPRRRLLGGAKATATLMLPRIDLLTQLPMMRSRGTSTPASEVWSSGYREERAFSFTPATSIMQGSVCANEKPPPGKI